MYAKTDNMLCISSLEEAKEWARQLHLNYNAVKEKSQNEVKELKIQVLHEKKKVDEAEKIKDEFSHQAYDLKQQLKRVKLE